MPWDAQERTRYEDEVLVAARAHGLPADLFTRYGVEPRLELRLCADPAAFTEHVNEVCAHWRALRSSRRSLREVLDELIAEHERLEGEGALTHAHFRQVRADEAQRVLSAWSEIAGGLTTSLLDRDTLRSMIAPVGVTEADAERVLLEHDVRVVDRLPELDDAPSEDTLRALRGHLRVRGVPFSPMEVFGEQRLAEGFTVLDGFRLHDGTALDKAALDEAVQRVRLEPESEGRAAAENVLEILRAEGDRADALVLGEIVGDLRERPEALNESGLARHWVGRGLAEEEALLLSAAVRRSASGADAPARAERDVHDLLADNRLRQAQEAAEDLPEDHDLHERLRARMQQVEELTAQAERALRAGDREEAARALAAAADAAADDEALAARLGEVATPPPRGVEARVDGRNVVVSWQPGPAPDESVTYRVTRRTGRDGSAREALVGESSGNEVTDTGAPVGAEARYAVVAVRDGLGVSEEASSAPVMIAPEVSSLRVRAGERSVSGSWQAPAEAVRVEVLRGVGAPPRGAGDGVRVETDGSGFCDTDVEMDVEYHYRIRAVYVTSNGHARGSAGLVRRASPGPCPEAVRDLSVVPDGGADFRASWTRPSRGRVVLRVGEEPPEWPLGTVLGPDDLESYGREVAQTPVADDEGAPEGRGAGRRSGTGVRAGAGRASGPPPGSANGHADPARGGTPGEEREGVRVLGPGERSTGHTRTAPVQNARTPHAPRTGAAAPEEGRARPREGAFRDTGHPRTTPFEETGAPSPEGAFHATDHPSTVPSEEDGHGEAEGVRVLGPGERGPARNRGADHGTDARRGGFADEEGEGVRILAPGERPSGRTRTVPGQDTRTPHAPSSGSEAPGGTAGDRAPDPAGGPGERIRSVGRHARLSPAAESPTPAAAGVGEGTLGAPARTGEDARDGRGRSVNAQAVPAADGADLPRVVLPSPPAGGEGEGARVFGSAGRTGADLHDDGTRTANPPSHRAAAGDRPGGGPAVPQQGVALHDRAEGRAAAGLLTDAASHGAGHGGTAAHSGPGRPESPGAPGDRVAEGPDTPGGTHGGHAKAGAPEAVGNRGMSAPPDTAGSPDAETVTSTPGSLGTGTTGNPGPAATTGVTHNAPGTPAPTGVPGTPGTAGNRRSTAHAGTQEVPGTPAAGAAPWNRGSAATAVPGNRMSAAEEQGAHQAQAPREERERVAFTLDSGTNHVLAVTVAGDQAVVGVSVRVTAAPPVEGLRAERFDTSVRLGWTWPEDACAAIISWRPEERGTETWTGGQLRCTRRQYSSDGGFETLMGPESVRVDVRAVVPFEGGEAVSSAATVTVPGRAVLDYRVEPAGLLRRDRVVHLVAEEDCTMPEVVVVYADGPVQPHTADQGTVLAVLPAQYLSAGEWVSVRVRPPRGTGQGWLMCFPADDDGTGVRLRQPPVRELRC
ncbi:hypothetical protein NGM33_24270 [Nocardiopsis dassonvillei]|uniref:hypothetical protein n=1 Tax=Nocardiopsis dassonvillei TaxID=2014 RepID=UPI0020A2BEBE|nr:hypothetical protein [Nocardiopsis dassonvillei]MCP3016450.1 hypothetical protein [Nocardiopsis dassonvillei]